MTDAEKEALRESDGQLAVLRWVMRKLLMWLVWNVPLGPLGPWVFGLAIGRRSHHVKEGDE